MGTIAEKLTYLNGTKTKIREGLNSLGADLTTEDTFRSYADVIENIYEDYPKITGEGESLTLDNTKQASMKIDLKGNTSQSSTPTPSSPIPVNVVSGDNEITICGKNLAPSDWASKFVNACNTPTLANITTKDNRNCLYYKINAGHGDYPHKNLTLGMTFKENTRYTISYDAFKVDATQRCLVIAYTDGTNQIGPFFSNANTWEHHTITSSANKTMDYVFVGYYAGDTYIDIDTWQIEEGTQATTYEPYIGNSYSLYLGVENLYDGSLIAGGLNASGTPVGISNEANKHSNLLPIFPNTTYTYYSLIPMALDGYCCWYDSNQNFISGFNVINSQKVTETSPSNAKYISITFNNVDGQKVQLEKGTKVNHTSTTQLELCKIGDYQDYIYKEDGSWYLHKEIGKVVLDGSETGWGLITSGEAPYYRYRYFDDAIGGSSLFSNLFIQNSTTTVGTELGCIINQNKEFRAREQTMKTLADWETFLSSNNLIVYYVLATPTNTLIEDTTLIEQLEELKLANSYEGQTNISQVNNDLPFILDVKALRGE